MRQIHWDVFTDWLEEVKTFVGGLPRSLRARRRVSWRLARCDSDRFNYQYIGPALQSGSPKMVMVPMTRAIAVNPATASQF